MHKFYRIKRDILACLMACMFIGGMGVDTYAAEVVDAQGAEGSGTEIGGIPRIGVAQCQLHGGSGWHGDVRGGAGQPAARPG